MYLYQTNKIFLVQLYSCLLPNFNFLILLYRLRVGFFYIFTLNNLKINYMESYAKVVEAIQFKGNITEVIDFMDSPNIITERDGSFIIVDYITGRWRVQPGDYIVKDFQGVTVYKQARFEAEYQVVKIEDELSVKDFIEVVAASNGGDIGTVSTHESGDMKSLAEIEKVMEDRGISIPVESPATPIATKHKKETKKE